MARRWFAIGVASLAFHAAILGALIHTRPTLPGLEEARSIEVTLATPLTPRIDPQPLIRRPDLARAPKVGPADRTDPPRPAPVAIAPPSPAVGQGAIVAPPGFTARGTPTGGGEALRQATRQSSCSQADIVKLTKAEREACAEALGAQHKNGPALYAAIDPAKKAAFDGDCKKDDDWCLYRSGKGPYPGLFAIGKKRKSPGWD